MTAEEFVTALRKYAGDSAIRIVLEDLRSPSGRKPPESVKEEAAWFAGLSAKDQEYVLRVARRAMDATLFGVFVILDGERVVEDDPVKGEFRVVYSKHGVEVELSNPSKCEEDLHDIYRGLYPFE